MRQRGLADAGHVFDQQMSAGDQAGEGQLDLARLAEQTWLTWAIAESQALLQRSIALLGNGGHGFFADGRGARSARLTSVTATTGAVAFRGLP